MAKTLNKVATVVGVVASIAAVIPGPWQPIAAIVAVAANVAASASAMAIRKPPALGNTTQILIGPNLPMPYAMGRTYVGGNLMLDVGYGATLSDVPNPYRSMVIVGAQGGPVDSFEAFQADFETITFSGAAATGYYGGFLWRSTQLGATPEGAALAGPHGAIPGWGAAYKLSGYAAWLVTMKFDRKGTVFASGVPQFGMIGKWAKTYDPRLDDTYTGGAGDHRFDDETTFEWSENPGLHGPTYARGRYQGDDVRKVIGCGFGQDAIDWPAWVAFANVCDANGWVLGGTIFEAPGQSKWDNLKRICAAGGAEPVFVGGLLSVRYPSPKTALDTITADDLADGDCVVPAMKGWKDRKNGIIPRYRSEEHKWEYVQSDLVSVEDYVTEDGEEKNEERQFDLVQDKDQAAQLAAYELVDSREFGPIVLPCKPRLIEYKPGEALEVDIPELGLNEQLCVIKGRSIDPATAIVTLTLESETTAKHAFALGLTGTAPPTPTITTGEEMDEIAQASATVATFEGQSIMPDLSTVSVYADHTGTVTPSNQLPLNIVAKRLLGSDDVTPSAAWSFAVLSGSVTATIGAATGILNVTALGASGLVEITSDYAGVSLSRRFLIDKAIGDPPPSSGAGSSSAYDSTIGSTNSVSYGAANAGPLTLTAGASGNVDLAAPLQVTTASASPDESLYAQGKWQWRVPAGAWADVSTEVISAVPVLVVDEGGGSYSAGQGSITINDQKTGLTPTTVYEFQLLLRNDSGTRTLSYIGTASATTS